MAAAGEAPQESNAPAVEVIPRTPPVNVLILGTDERPYEGGPQRTDTIILATLDQESQTAGMLSIPRDLYVPLASTGITTKINTAYGIGQGQNYPGGGPQLVMDTVSTIVGQPVPYYVRLNFEGFVQMVDLIGGIDVNVPKTILDDDYPTATEGITETFYLDAGFQHLDGATALKYARTRNVDDDYGRSGRQQDVIRAVLEKVRSADMIPTLLANAPALLNTLRTSVDTNIPVDKLIELATWVNENPPREFRQLVLDNRYGEETYSPEGMWILVPDRQKVRAAVSTFFTPPAATPDAAVSAAVNPTTVHLEVLNGTGVPGMAAKVRDLLGAQGWQVVSIGDADRGDYTQSVLINYGVSDTVIQQVSSALGLQLALASVSGLNDDTHVDARIVIGQDVLPMLNR
jgi:LCP family protein required for cell wall assembly